MELKSLLAVVAGAAFAVCASADTWYADASKDAGTGDGRSPGTAFHTIQEAIDAASAGDTVKVGPGVYDQGATTGPGSSTYGQLSRVAIDKRISLIATEGRDKTIIFGGTNSLGNCKADTGLVSCIYIHEAAKGTVIRGFTLKGGSLNQSIYGGGGVTFGGGTDSEVFRRPGDDYFVEFCRIEDCSAKYGGGMAGGTAVGTIFNHNWVYSSGEGAGAYGIDAFDCLFTDNNEPSYCHTSPALYNAGTAVNCTFVNNHCAAGFGQNSAAPRYYNVVEVENNRTSTDTTRVIDTGVIEGSYDTANSEGVTVIAAIQPTNSNNPTDPHSDLMMAPVLGDYRPVAGGTLDKKGKRDSLALIPERYRNLDFNGNVWDSTTADVPIGVILPAATPANGKAVQVQRQMYLNGRLMALGRTFIQSDKVPVSVRCRLSATAISGTLFAYQVQLYSKTRYIHADRDGGLCYTLAYDGTDANTPSWISTKVADNVVYVDAENGSDDNDGSSPSLAKQSLSGVRDVLVSGKYNVIFAAPGVYSNKSDEATSGGEIGRRVRFLVPSKCHTSLRATSPSGAADTIIEGEPDSEAPAAASGCGLNAIGGAAFPNNANVGISGFTFRKCRTKKDPVNNDNRNRGAAVYCAADSIHQLCDCVFENNCSYGVGACVYGGWAVRCLFRDNPMIGDYLLYGTSVNNEQGTMSGCLVIDSTTRYLIGNYASAYNTTFYLPGKGSYEISGRAQDRFYNNVCVGGGKLTEHATGYLAGCVVGTGVTDQTTAGTLKRDPQMVNLANGEFRVAAGSCALSAGSASADIPMLGFYSTTDFYNNPLFPVAGGPIPAGAVTAVYEPKTVYVDAENGDDVEGDGLTPETAFKTLQKVMTAVNLYPGDVVEAAPGDYDKGEMDHTGYIFVKTEHSVKSRVVVPTGVTLRSAAGKAVTRIVGGGEEDLRAVFIEADAKVVGFTITNGNAHVNVAAYQTKSDDDIGGGVLGRGAAVSTVVDCDITGNMSCEAPIAYVTVDRCTVTQNHPFMGANSGVLMRECGARNSYINHNLGNATILNYAGDIVNCTIGGDNYNPVGKTAAYSIRGYKNDAKIVNTVVYQHQTTATMTLGYVANSVLPGGSYSISEMGPGVVTNITFAEVEAMFNADGTPKFMEGGLAIDKGGEADVGAVDLAGNPRIMNGCIDLGAFEADWRGRYGADMCKSAGRMTVEDVSAGVVEDDGKVVIPADESVTFRWSLRAGVSEGEFQIRATLSGDAQLAVYVNGERIGTLPESGDFTVAAVGAETKVRLVCESEGGEGSAQIECVKSLIGTLMILR